MFDVQIYRALTTYQFSNRLLFRNISEYNTLDGTLDLNFLLTYRVNAGTVFYAGYDDHYQQADLIAKAISWTGTTSAVGACAHSGANGRTARCS